MKKVFKLNLLRGAVKLYNVSRGVVRILLLLVTILVALPLVVCAQPNNSLQDRQNENNLRFALPDDIKTQLDNFFASMVKKDYKTGLEHLLLNSPVSQKDTDFANILREIGKSIELYGDIKGYEIVDFKLAGSSYFKVKIIGLQQKFPTRWEINFYRSPEMGLIVTNFKFDDVSDIYIND